MFTVGIPFGPFETGDTVTADAVRQSVPGADLARLVRLESLIPVGGFDVGTLATPAESQEQAEGVIDELHAKVTAAEDARDKAAALHDAIHGELVAAVQKLNDARHHLTTLASGTMNVQFLRDEGDHKAGDVVSPSAVASKLPDYLDSGACGWTEKPVPAAPPATDAGEIVVPETPAEMAAAAEKPAKNRKPSK